jgi:hypothetical protein
VRDTENQSLTSSTPSSTIIRSNCGAWRMKRWYSSFVQ